jgi:MYXO-CTERM domain-containing protein
MPALRPSRNPGDYATSTHKVGRESWISGGPAWVAAIRLAVAVAAASATGCAAEPAAEDLRVQLGEDTSSPSIFGGQKDDDEGALEGVVALRVGTGTTFELCSGALVAPNVVLTARHCVTRNLTSAVSCDDKGNSANGKHVIEDEDPSVIGVYLGASPSFAKAPVAKVRAIVAPGGPYLCDSDIALVVLETPIRNVAPLAVRLRRPARTGEMIRAVGYGQNDQSSPIGTRFRKGGVAVLAQGAGVSASKTPLGPHEFEVGLSICQGDSGGPAISEETGAVIGVVSRGGGCTEDFGHIYTTTTGFDEMFTEAFRQAGATPTGEDDDLASTGASTRSKSTATPGSPEDDASTSSSGCAVASRTSASGTGSAIFAFVAAAMLALGLRRRRTC